VTCQTISLTLRLGAVALLGLALAPGCTPSIMIASGAMSDQAPSGDTLSQLQQESAPYRRKGTGVIAGQVFVTTEHGPVYASPGTTVLLAPDTEYSNVRFQKFVVEGNEVPPAVRAAVAWMTKTKADGEFMFRDLPGGTYLVASQVFWTPPGADEARSDIPYARLQLAEGASVTTEVTRPAD
jgi:hypothetical protein